MVGATAAKRHCHRAPSAGSSWAPETSTASTATSFAAAKAATAKAATALTAAGLSRTARSAGGRITALLLSNGGVFGGCRPAETESLGDAQVHREESGPLAEVARNDLDPWLRVDIEIAKPSNTQVLDRCRA